MRFLWIGTVHLGRISAHVAAHIGGSSSAGGGEAESEEERYAQLEEAQHRASNIAVF